MRYHDIIVIAIAWIPILSAFEWKSLFNPPTSSRTSTAAKLNPKKVQAVAALEEKLLQCCRSQSLPASQMVTMFEELEQINPSNEMLLTDPESLGMIDGPWNLLYTISNYVGSEESLSTSGVGGVVNASGIQVKATEDRVPIQAINTTSLQISNEVFTNAPIIGEVLVKVMGSFKAVPGFGRRAEVEFQRLEVYKAQKGEKKGSIFSAEWPFKLLKKIKPELTNGADPASWLDTTYLSPRVRLGRGNKGSIFVLEKQEACTSTEEGR
jgi:hypothetical protein